MKELRFSLATVGAELWLDAWLIADGRSEVRALQQPVPRPNLGDPDLLPDRDLGRRWGMTFGTWLHQLLPDGGVDRISFRPLDLAAARLPFETLVSPDDEGGPIFTGGVSLIRLPQRLDAPLRPPGALAGSEPGRHVARALAAPARDLDLDAFVDAVASLEGRRGLRASVVAAADECFAGEFGDDHVDLLVCCGHGTRDDGWQLPCVTLSGEALARHLDGRPAAVILAMCQSAFAAARLTASGIGLAVGFQGRDSPEIDVRNFVRETTDALREPLLDGADMFAAWERALIAGRGRLSHHEGVLPVVVVHPDLLAGVTRARVTNLRTDRPPRAPATARPFYVPGQVCCWRENERTLRLPLPVDAGVLLTLRVTTEGRRGSALADAWRLPEHWGLAIECSPPSAVAGWATSSAELSAAIRALSHLLGEPPPDAVLALLDETVARDWGAPDAAPRGIESGSGARVVRFAQWPALDVDATITHQLPGEELRKLRLPALEGLDAASLATALRESSALLDLINGFRHRVTASVPPSLLAGRKRYAVFVPSAAAMRVAKRASGSIRMVGEPSAGADASDTLRVR